jgi:hypothetical protein
VFPDSWQRFSSYAQAMSMYYSLIEQRGPEDFHILASIKAVSSLEVKGSP